jgi:hypothetical protein
MPDGTTSFEFASKKALAPAKAIDTFQIDGEDYFIRALKDSRVAYLVHKTRGGAPDVIISAVLDFTEQALLPESAKRFEARALGTDGGDGLDLDQIVQVFNHILGVVAANPTGGPSKPSSPSPRKTGSASPATRRLQGVPNL